ncbi:hypothetical protein U4E84_10450 [Halorubrum sp. AD140]|uniref:hypothetical protein n=1 Tax=Halorubrum sp. AD140 TaxID=3050073 RepID=UPI002ACCC251|nr:hypothetical protein [Halorubrum sp. AD140]MDZ5811759.1 hypothetical protein [Halorubrum sp. AD140]
MIEEWRERYFIRTGVLAGLSTVIMTASFIGILAVIENQVSGLESRAPWYLVFAAFAFTVTVVFLERNDVVGRVIIGTALALGIVSFLLSMLTVEGLFYTIRNPEDVFVSRLVLYFLAAGLVGTGFGYWAINHWREFTSPDGAAENRL